MTVPIISMDIEMMHKPEPVDNLVVRHLGGHGETGDPYRVTGPLATVLRYALTNTTDIDRATVDHVVWVAEKATVRSLDQAVR